MELLTPGTGLLFWQVVIFLLLLLVLSKYACKPITESLKEREKFIDHIKKNTFKDLNQQGLFNICSTKIFLENIN